MLFRRTHLRRAQKLLGLHDLAGAATVVLQHRLAEWPPAQSWCGELTQGLYQQAQRQTLAREFAAAWESLQFASRIGNHFEPRRVVQARQELVERTIQGAELWLREENLNSARETLEQLRRQHILDCRADQIGWVISQVAASEAHADAGQWKQAKQSLDAAVARRADLPWLAARAARLHGKMEQAASLARRLQDALLRSNWRDVRDVSHELLGIAPHYPVAVDALRRCQQADSRGTTPHRAAAEAAAVTPTPTATSSSPAVPVPAAFGKPAAAPMATAGRVTTPRRFIWWIDGVGGYLACGGEEWWLGRAVPAAAIEIPIQGDLSRRHAKITRKGRDYLLTPYAPTKLDGVPLDRPTLLKSGQTIVLGDHVQIRFTLPHPYSATAKLEVVSRHRTLPWTDSILLVADTVLIGPHRQSHIVHSGLEQPLVLLWAAGGWECRPGGNVVVAGEPWPIGLPLPTARAVSVDGLSMTLETVGEEKVYV